MSDVRLNTSVKGGSIQRAAGDSRQFRGTRDGSVFTATYVQALGLEGRIFYSSDADQNDYVTGQTSFANTTPTFLLRVPSGTTAIPLAVRLRQAGTVAGGQIDVIIEIDNADRYSSGGTSETVLSSRTDNPVTNNCTLYSGATAAAGYGVRIFGLVGLEQDVTPLYPELSGVDWIGDGSDYLVGPAAFAVYTYAATTGPTWSWAVKWAEIPSTDLN